MFKCIQMVPELVPALFGKRIAGVWFSADELFCCRNQSLVFKSLEVTGKVPVGHFKNLLQAVETEGIVDHQDRHYAEPDPAFKDLIKTGDQIFHISYFLYIIIP